MKARIRNQRSEIRSQAAILFVAVFLLAMAVPAAQAQTVSINWWSMDSGGGTSTGGLYSVSGTIGQPDAGGPMTNGQYSVVGGFWALPIAVQTTNAPTLTIVPAAPGFAAISWSPPSPGFILQSSVSLSPTSWVTAGTNNPVIVPTTVPARFYRLLKTGP
jgi:hypothetical protein